LVRGYGTSKRWGRTAAACDSEQVALLQRLLEDAYREFRLFDGAKAGDPEWVRMTLAKEIMTLAAQQESEPTQIKEIAVKRVAAQAATKGLQASLRQP
jgi:hypothetical protein